MMQISEKQESVPVARDQTEDFLNFLPGQRLKRARELRGWGRDQVAKELYLSVKFIEAIENDHYDVLPGITFARGYIRSYARMMQLDDNDVVVKFEQAIEVRSSDPAVVSTGINPIRLLGNFSVNPRKSLSKAVRYAAIGIVLSMVAGGFLWSFHETFNPGSVLDKPEVHKPAPVPLIHETLIHAPQEVTSVAQVAPVAATTLTLPLQSSGTADNSEPLKIQFNEEAWVRVQDAKGSVLAVGIQPAGTILHLSGTAPWHIRVGNADQVQILVMGRAVDLSAHTHDRVADVRVQP